MIVSYDVVSAAVCQFPLPMLQEELVAGVSMTLTWIIG